nr:MAG TPA: hypothetical protein [Caudoviricetes sp.]
MFIIWLGFARNRAEPYEKILLQKRCKLLISIKQ